MIAGLPGAGIGGLFYLATTFLLPVRGLVRRLHGQSDDVPWRLQTHSVLIATGIVGGVWAIGWVLGVVMPDEMVIRQAAGQGSGAGVSRNALAVASIAMAAGTLAVVLVAVEVAHHLQRAATVRRRRASQTR